MNRIGKWKAAQSRGHWQEGSIGDLLSVGLCILAMTAAMMAFLDCTQLINQKTAVSQLARNYILRMETVGYLTPADEEKLTGELAQAGVKGIDLEGTTRQAVGYGAVIVLRIRGNIGEGYAFEEKRVSTAKH